MIGLGSNRLTVCRRGGMSVTQAGRGGMEWLAGGRMPSWASPYSAQATAALKDAFTAAQWATIRDYGFAHPEIVGYMNAYAPEDAKIAYSLVEGIGTRWIIGTGTQWINTEMKLNTDIGYRAKFDCTGTSYGKRLMGAADNSTYYAQVKWVTNNRYHVQVGGGTTEQFFTLGYVADIMAAGNPTATVTANGEVVSTTLPRRNPMKEMVNFYIFAMNNGSGGASDIANCKIAYVKLWSPSANTTESNPSGWFVPFIRENVIGMLDLVSGNFKTNAGSGSFTISETPAS